MPKRVFIIVFLLAFLSFLMGGRKEAAMLYLDEIASLVDGSVKGWSYSTDGCSWKSYSTGSWIGAEKVWLSSELELPSVFSGVRVEGTPVKLWIKTYGRGLIEGEVLVDGRKIGQLKIDASDRTSKEKEFVYELFSSLKPGSHKVEIRVENKGFYPPRTHYWPPRSRPLKEEGIFFALREARLIYPEAEKVYSRVRNWVDSMKVAYVLLNPVLVKKTFTGHPYPIEDKRKVSKKRIEKLNSIWAEAVLAFDKEALEKGETRKLLSSIDRSFRIARPVKDYVKQFTVYLVGNAHIDIAWLWRIYETMEVARATYATVLKNMEEYPELIYAQSQAITYEWMEKQHPEIFEKIKKMVKEGRWEIVGGMWLEPDCNLISGESWVRQILYGKRYFKEKFGVDVKVGWNIDSFGYNWNMPQIYRLSGIDYFITQKILWNDTTVFPYNIFWWEGVDGTRILSYFPPVGYTSRVRLERTVKALSTYEATTGYKKTLILYGLGDHGGGPNREILNRVRNYSKLEIAPRFVHTRALDFLKKIVKEVKDIPVWKDELYLEYHRGTYTTQAAIKKNNRRSEVELSITEKLASIASLFGFEYPKDKIKQAWKLVLTNQFHDILPGSGINPIYRDAIEFYKKAYKILGKVKKKASSALLSRIDTEVEGKPLVVFNPLSWTRTDFVQIRLDEEEGTQWCVRDDKGNVVPSEVVVDEDGVKIGFIAEKVPPVGYKVYSLVKGKSCKVKTDLKASGYVLENSFLRIEVNPETGNIRSIYDKRLGKEFVAKGKEANVLQIYEDIPERWDAWNIGYTGRMWELNKADEVKLVHVSPVRAVIRVKKSFLGFSKSRYSPTEYFPSSFFVQDITLYAGLDRMDVKMKADWWETHMMLKVAFPVDVRSDKAAYEIPFATIERTTKFETLWEKARFEVPALKWADLSDSRGGVSLLNDSKYGYDIHGNVMKLSLLRAPVWPDPMADRGKHEFTYSIYTHAGSWKEAETVHRGYELNTPLQVFFAEKHKGVLPRTFSFFSVQPASVVLDTVKMAEDGRELVLRLYESAGKPTTAKISFFRSPVKVWVVNLMEENPKEVEFKGNSVSLSFHKFEIKTLKVKF